MSNRAPILDFAALKRGGVMRQVHAGHFSLRLHVIAGRLTALELESIARIARQFGRGEVHLTARQGVEIPHVSNLAEARVALEQAGLQLGACGPRVRTVTGCQGAELCLHGLAETRALCEAIDREFAGWELPHKLKFSVSGCPNGCLKPQENDIGIMGALEPLLHASACTGCMVCTSVCDQGALTEAEARVALCLEPCNLCGDCVSSCPNDALLTARRGYVLYLGGRLGRDPRLGERYGGLIQGIEPLMRALRGLVELYKAQGRRGERFGRMLERLDRSEVESLIASCVQEAEGAA